MIFNKKRIIEYGGVVINNKKPIRQCISCRNQFPREQLIRIVKTTDSISNSTQTVLNPNKFQLGRSAYLCKNASCVNLALKGKKVEKMLRAPAKILESVIGSLAAANFSKEEVAYV